MKTTIRAPLLPSTTDIAVDGRLYLPVSKPFNPPRKDRRV